MPSLGQFHLHLCLNVLGLGHLSHCFQRVLCSWHLHASFFFAHLPRWACTRMIFTSVLEEFVHLPEFVLVSMIVLIGSVRPNWCVGVTLFYYFRFLFITCENYWVERQGNLLTKILLLHIFNVSTPVRHYASMTVRQYVSTPVRQYASTPVCQYTSMPVRQYASTPVRQYTSMPVCQYASTPVRQYASMPVRQLYKPQQGQPLKIWYFKITKISIFKPI